MSIQDINVLLEFNPVSGIVENFKIIKDTKQLLDKKNITPIKIENENSSSCDQCFADFKIILYQVEKGDLIKDILIPEIKIEKIDEEIEHSESIIIKEEYVVLDDDSKSTELSNNVEPKKKNKGGNPGRKRGKYRPRNRPRTPSPEKNADGFYFCQTCKTEFEQKKQIGLHRCTGTYKGKYRIGPNPNCYFCDKKFINWHEARIHELKYHLNVQEFTLTCEYCAFTTKHKQQLQNHIMRMHIHKDPKPYKCDLCPFKCSTMTSIRNHMKVKHLKIGLIICEICSKMCATPSALKNHLETRHNHVRNHICKHCSKAFKSQKALDNHHTKIHLPPEERLNFRCEHCNMVSYNKTSFNLHRLTHLENDKRPFKCNVCGKGFVGKAQLQSHMAIHSEYRPFQCEFCDKSFKKKETLKIHTRYHTGEKPYECEICKQRYSDRGCYRSHLMVHEKQLGITLDKSVKKFVKSQIVPLVKNDDDQIDNKI